MTAKRSPLRMAAAALILIFGLSFIVFVASQSSLTGRDSVAYWAGGRLLLAHQNPYDLPALAAMARAGGAGPGKSALVRYPPYGLLFELVVGAFSPRMSQVVWILGLIAALMISIRLLWQMEGRPPDRIHLLAYLFPPALCCLLAGQVGLLLLLAFTLFLYLHERHPYLAGCALSICLMKPHLMVLPIAVLLAWTVSRKRFKILAGGGLTLLASGLLPLYFDRHIWSHYLAGFRGEHIENEFIPALSVVFRLAIHREWWILQFVPMFAGLIWAIVYFWRRRERWDWMQHGPLLAAVGVLVAPYAWMTDETLALPAVLIGLYALQRTGRSIVPYAIAAFAGLIEVLFTVPPGSGFYLWTASTWVAWYVYATRPARLAEPSSVAVSGARSS